MKKVIIKGRWNEPIKHEWEGDLITTLIEMNILTIEEDNTGYFFDVEQADRDYIEAMGLPIFKNIFGVLTAPTDYTIVEED